MTFEAIKECAINEDVERLNQIIAGPDSTVSIDVTKPGSTYLTPAAELAREGNLVAVEFLKEHGACVNAIAEGFAHGGHAAEVERYRTLFGACVADIAYGFALGGHAADADRYLREFGISAGYIARGFAQGGHAAEADRYRIVFNADVNTIAFGFAHGGHTADADRYRIEFGAYAGVIAFGFALGGHTAAADSYRIAFEADVDNIAYGFAFGGHTAAAFRYRIALDASSYFIARGFNEGKHRAEAQQYQAMLDNYLAATAPTQPIIANHPTAAERNGPTSAPYCPSRNTETPTRTEEEKHELYKVAEDLGYTCPISLEIMTDPVSIFGHELSGSFERSAIEKWLETNNRHPLTNAIVDEKTLVPNTELKEKINGFEVKKLEI